MKKLLAICILATGTLFAQFNVGIHIGPMPRIHIEHQSRRPTILSIWIAGHWDIVNEHYVWDPGYWTEPPYEGAIWYAPVYDGNVYYYGYWNGDKGRVEHGHDRHESGKHRR